MIAAYRRRKRLEIHSVIERSGSPNLKRYKDPETDKHYVGMGRWDPFMIRSAYDKFLPPSDGSQA